MKATKFKFIVLLVIFILTLSACTKKQAEAAALLNPDAEYCAEQGYNYHIHEDEQGNQYGVCVFAKGDECDAWAFYHGECGPTEPTQVPESEPTNTLPPKPTKVNIELNPYEDLEFWLTLSYPSSWSLNLLHIGEENGQTPVSRLLQFSKDDYQLSIHYKNPSDPTVIGGELGAGEIVEGKMITILGQTVHQMQLVYKEKVKLVWYSAQSEGLSLYGKLEDISYQEYDNIEISVEIQAEAENILTSLHRTESFEPASTDSEEVNGWVGVIVSAPDMPQVDDYFQILDQNGSRYGIDSLDPEIREALENYRDTGILLKVWGTLYQGRMDAYNTQIEVIHFEEYQD